MGDLIRTLFELECVTFQLLLKVSVLFPSSHLKHFNCEQYFWHVMG
jgi:hypothetical protein